MNKDLKKQTTQKKTSVSGMDVAEASQRDNYEAENASNSFRKPFELRLNYTDAMFK